MKKKQKITAALKKKAKDRGPVTVYFSADLFKRFRKACGDHSASEVLEELMREFLQE